MKRILFKETPYLFVGDSLEEGGAIATEAQYQDGLCSFAHLFDDGMIRRFNAVIGSRGDITVVEDDVTIEENDCALGNILTGIDWGGGMELPDARKKS